MSSFRILIVLILLSMAEACSPPSPYDHIRSDEIRSILEQSIQHTGGLESWQNSAGISYKKRSITYSENGSIESKNTYVINLNNQRNPEGEIIWNNNTDTTSIIIKYNNGNAIKYIDGVAQSSNSNREAKELFLDEYQNMMTPYQLLNKNIVLHYDGKKSILDKTTEVVIADYSSNNNTSIPASRKWHYFDATTFEHVGFKEFNNSEFLLLENLKSNYLNGIKYPVDQIIWSIDSTGRKKYIKAKAAISNLKALNSY